MNYMGDSTWWNERFKNRELNIMGHEICLEADLNYLPFKGKILDVASGDGRNAIYLARLGYEIIAIDFSDEAIKRLRYFSEKENLKIRTMLVDLSKDNMQSLGEMFDEILINHYRLSQQRYSDLINYLKKNGLLWVNGFRAIPRDNPNVKETDIILETDFELINKNILMDKKLYECNQREFVRYIWSKK